MWNEDVNNCINTYTKPQNREEKYKSFLLINQPKSVVNFGQAHYKNGIDLLSPPKNCREILQYCPCFALFRPILPVPTMNRAFA